MSDSAAIPVEFPGGERGPLRHIAERGNAASNRVIYLRSHRD